QPRLALPPATFDATASGKLEVHKAPTGHLLVNPKIAGRDLGAFIFDTGAGSTVIDPAIAKTAGFEQFGSVPVVGGGGPTDGSFYEPDSISLGPVTLDKPILVGSDLSFLKPFMGETIAGVIGFDFLSRCVVEIDLAEGHITLHDPSKYTLANGQWTDLVLYG